jgi:hypothetical protein
MRERQKARDEWAKNNDYQMPAAVSEIAAESLVRHDPANLAVCSTLCIDLGHQIQRLDVRLIFFYVLIEFFYYTIIMIWFVIYLVN